MGVATALATGGAPARGKGWPQPPERLPHCTNGEVAGLPGPLPQVAREGEAPPGCRLLQCHCPQSPSKDTSPSLPSSKSTQAWQEGSLAQRLLTPSNGSDGSVQGRGSTLGH